MSDRCGYSDLPRETCAHCGAAPGDRPRAEHPWRWDGRGIGGRALDDGAPMPETHPSPLHLTTTSDGRCACGQPTRDDAYACDDCSDELARILGDLPWIVEQLELTITRQRGKQPGAGARTSDGIPWHDKAANILHALRAELVSDVRLCIDDHVRHSSPATGWPADNPKAMSRWLLWRVDGLAFHEGVTEILRTLLRIEDNALHVVDRSPDRKYLGSCTAPMCGGSVYAIGDARTGRCSERDCRAEYDTEASRRGLELALDDRLCTASEIAHLATYLGIPASRDRVRNLVNQWHKRKRITARGTDDDEVRFRYGDVAPLLAATYEQRAEA